MDLENLEKVGSLDHTTLEDLDNANMEDIALGTLGLGETPIIGTRGLGGQIARSGCTSVVGIHKLHDPNDHNSHNKDLYAAGTPWSYEVSWEKNHSAHKYHNKEYDSSYRGHKPDNRNKKKQIKNKRT